MKTRAFLLGMIPGLICSAVGVGILVIANSQSANAAAPYPKLSGNAIRSEFIDTETYRGMKLERMIDSQLKVACYRREPSAQYDCVKL